MGVELTPADGRALYIPEGCAHGFQTLADDTEVLYQISVAYRPDSGRTLRYSDPHFGIEWPLEVTAISDRDRECPLVDPVVWKERPTDE